ncbi:MAG: 4-hydroxy-tetrahydrodipicolinate synthase [Akkermansiaceae bacterium]|jgi:4-hydroxy-tetrahydrodipicolinate synthase
MRQIEGIVPVMLTPMKEGGALDPAGLERLTDWYLANDAGALFAVCQSSEMQHLTVDERVSLARQVIAQAQARVPVVVSGHIATTLDDQIAELRAMAATRPDALILVTNRLDPDNKGPEAFRHALERILAALPDDVPLGLYECPAPFRRLLSDDELAMCRDTGRFVALKDVSCDLETVKRRVKLTQGSPLNIINANAAIALAAMRAGSKGFAGVLANFHCDLYAWMYRNHAIDNDLMRELEVFLAMAGNIEAFGYPRNAKRFHMRQGRIASDDSRVWPEDIRGRFWALDEMLDHLETGSAQFRKRFAALHRD